MKNFSKASAVMFDIIEKSDLDKSDKRMVRVDLSRLIEKVFSQMNTILRSNLTHKEKENFLVLTRDYATYQFKDDIYKDGFTWSDDVVVKALGIKLLSYIFSIIDSKYKRSIKYIETQIKGASKA